MKKLIRNILREQWEEETKLSNAQKNKVWKLFDKLTIEKTLPHFQFSIDNVTDVISGYYLDHADPKYNPVVDVVFNNDDIAKHFSDDMEEMVKNYLSQEWDYPWNECFEYDSNWMLDDISEENMSFMRKSANIAVGEDEDEVIDYIGERFGDVIGCTHSEAQQDADTAELHKDIDIAIEDFFSEIDGEWNWDKQIFVGKISVSELAKSDIFNDTIWGEIEYSNDIDWDDVLSQVFEFELDNMGNSEIFPNKPYINEDKHFRYGGAGDMDKEYFNELLYDRLQEEIDVE